MMKRIILLISVVLLLAGCQKEDEPVIKQETGTVMNYAGADHCSIIIELDNGQTIIPLQYPDEFKFYHGQELRVTYSEIPNVVSTCNKGKSSTLYNIEEISPGPAIVDAGEAGFDSLTNTPVLIHTLTLKDDYLELKVSFSGGCRNHTINLVKTESEEQEEDTAVLMLHHNSNEDYCEAALTMDIRFNISPLRDQGYTSFYFKALLLDGNTLIEQFDLEQ